MLRQRHETTTDEHRWTLISEFQELRGSGATHLEFFAAERKINLFALGPVSIWPVHPDEDAYAMPEAPPAAERGIYSASRWNCSARSAAVSAAACSIAKGR